MQDDIGDVPLHGASDHGHVNVMTVLIQRGAQVDYQNKVNPWSIVCRFLLSDVNKIKLQSTQH